MKNFYDLIEQAKSYMESYARQYGIADETLLNAIFVSHLAYLLNEK